MKPIRFVDLFAGIGGFRLGFELAARDLGVPVECVYTSEIKPPAIKVYSENFEKIESSDITQINASDISDFEVLLAGFPCQAFSSAGNRHGFMDTRGTLFFDVARIAREKRPSIIILENVEGLVNHDRVDSSDSIGRTLKTIIAVLEDIGYEVTWKVLDASDFGLAQKRKRIFIVGSLKGKISLSGFKKEIKLTGDILQKGLPTLDSEFTRKLLSKFKTNEIYGKAIKDKRGGKENIHSWDIELKGKVTQQQRKLLEELLKARRNKKWGFEKGIAWMDGMPLTVEEIRRFYDHPKLQEMLDDLTNKGYLSYEHPKDLVTEKNGSIVKTIRTPRLDLEKGYNIVSGKLSFEFSKILDPNNFCPTIVATDVDRIGVVDGDGIRRLSEVEQLRLFGFPDDFKMPIKDREKFDLFGNTVPVSVVKAVSERAINSMLGKNIISFKESDEAVQDKLFELEISNINL